MLSFNEILRTEQDAAGTWQVLVDLTDALHLFAFETEPSSQDVEDAANSYCTLENARQERLQTVADIIEVSRPALQTLCNTVAAGLQSQGLTVTLTPEELLASKPKETIALNDNCQSLLCWNISERQLSAGITTLWSSAAPHDTAKQICTSGAHVYSLAELKAYVNAISANFWVTPPPADAAPTKRGSDYADSATTETELLALVRTLQATEPATKTYVNAVKYDGPGAMFNASYTVAEAEAEASWALGTPGDGNFRESIRVGMTGGQTVYTAAGATREWADAKAAGLPDVAIGHRLVIRSQMQTYSFDHTVDILYNPWGFPQNEDYFSFLENTAYSYGVEEVVVNPYGSTDFPTPWPPAPPEDNSCNPNGDPGHGHVYSVYIPLSYYLVYWNFSNKGSPLPPPPPPAAGMTVADAGETGVNGVYTDTGTPVNGKPSLRLGTTSYYLEWTQWGNYWQIAWGSPDGMPLYYSMAGGDTPPTTGWAVAMGQPPAPTVS